MIKQVRTREAYQAKVEQAIQREISLAQEGQIAAVSSKAAAFYLGKHKDTLADWRQPPPKGPPFDKGADGIGVRNEHVSYPWPELVKWKSERAGKTAKERKLQDELDKILQQAHELDLELQIQQARDQLAKAQKKLGRKLGFASLNDAIELDEWATDGEIVLGHVLTISDTALDQALAHDQVIDASLAEVLTLPWDQDARVPFLDAWISITTSQARAMADANAMSDVVRTDRTASDLSGLTKIVDRAGRRNPL